MRVGIVSAHYPPNFISGGTLVPMRMAQGLAARDHQVAVFAGRLDAAEPPLDVTVETDEAGVAITWVNTTPWTGWDDVRNYTNPEVDACFERWLDATRPDVVHFHSLQSLGGAGLLIARRRGIPTVLTMHDFWWFCARQFLVDNDSRPCSLVVDAGGCACQAGRSALEERTRVLAPYLQAADVVLAPSAIAAAVFEANGVDPARLVVNENGMDLERPTTDVDAASPAGGPVRFRYAGGPHAMKGAHVLVAAVEGIAADASWHLTIHTDPADRGILERLAGHDSVTFAPPYQPEELDAVFAQTDVLVLPSMMRETHSIITREALLRGVAVIAANSLGPIEVVRHGHNGLVIPPADAPSLAAALRTLIDDPALVARLRGAASAVTVVSTAQQIDRLEAILTDLADRPATPVEAAWTPRDVLFVVGIDGAPLRYRAQFPAEALGLIGVRTRVLHYNDPRVDKAVERADAVVFYRVPATPRVVAIADGIDHDRVPVVFDVDDLIVDPSIADEIPALRLLPPDEARLWLEGIQRYRTTLEHCDAYIGSTAPLVERVGAVTGLPAHLKRNSYGLQVAQRSDQARRAPRTEGPVRIGYFSGTTTHDEDLLSVTPALVRLLERHDDLEVWLGGMLPAVAELDAFAPRIKRVPFRPWTELPDLLRQVDINLAPMADFGLFNQAKSAIKWLEAALVETPTVASATRPFLDAVDDGETGVLIHSAGDDDANDDEWFDALDRLVASPAERRRIGASAHQAALLAWSPHLEGRRYVEILQAVHAAPRPVRASTWVDVANPEDAAPGPVPLTPYPVDGGVTIATVPAPSAPADPGLVHKLTWSLRNEDPTLVATRVARRVRDHGRQAAALARRFRS